MTPLQQFISQYGHEPAENNCLTFAVPANEIVEVAKYLSADLHLPLKLITATDDRQAKQCFTLWYVFFSPEEKQFIIPYVQLEGTTEFPSLTPTILEARHHERKIRTFFGLTPVGHPDPRPIVLHEHWPTDIFPLRKDVAWDIHPAPVSGEYAFQKVEGEGIYEIPVGPIHAGIIEPGHFRFSVAGEEIMLLEPRLGYVHKGTEKLFERLPLAAQVRLAEQISGDSSFSHALAFCQAVEQLGDIDVPARAKYLRVMFAELERVANHIGDIGAMMLDTGYNFGGSNGARLREKVLRVHERLSGNRFLRGMVQMGGVTRDLTSEDQTWLSGELAEIEKDFLEVLDIANSSVTLLNRLEGTGVLERQAVEERGVVGVAARAAGIARDVRCDLPYAAYDQLPCRVVTETAGDVQARFHVRVQEVRVSMDLIQAALGNLPSGPFITTTPVRLKPNSLTISAVEGWRGEIVYFVTTDDAGAISRVAPRDPSFMNWPAIGQAGVGNVVPDFPLINKSFNLSYSGNDL